MSARSELVATAVEMGQRYYEGIEQGPSLYDHYAADLPGGLPDPKLHRTGGPSHTEDSRGPSDMDPSESGPSDTEGSDPDVGNGRGSLTRSRGVRVTMSRQPTAGRVSEPEVASPPPVRHRRVRFNLAAQTQTQTQKQPRPAGHSWGGVGQRPQVRKHF